MPWFSRQNKAKIAPPPAEAPPNWTPAPEQSHDLGLLNEATDEEFLSGEAFCAQHPVEAPRLLPSEDVDRIETNGGKAWTLEWPPSPRFVGRVDAGGEKGAAAVTTVTTAGNCGDVCLLSTLPIMGGLYETQGKSGIYYEVCIRSMKGIIAIGTACRPYPQWRFPGWNRCSAALHLDDMRKFYEDPNGGRDYDPILSSFSEGDFIGCGYDFSAASIFFTYNGRRLSDAFGGVYVPRTKYDVYAAVGVEGQCHFEVNFGGEPFKWKEANEWAWRIEGHVGRLSASSSRASHVEDELPTYDEARRQR